MIVPAVCVLFTVFYCVLCYSPLSKQIPVSEAVAAPPDKSLYRLPHDIIPLSYHIHLTPYFHVNNFTFDGNLLFYFNAATDSVRDIVLNSVNLTITDVKLENKNSATSVIVSSTFLVDTDLGRLIVTANEALISNTTYALTVLYNGPLRGSDDLHGFYYGSYIEDNQTVYFAATQFESTHARKAFPCLDEPGFRAQIMVHIMRDSSLMTVSNVQLMRQQNHTITNKVMDIYQLTDPMPSYLAAFFIGRFSQNTQGNNSVFARKEYIGHSGYALSLIPTVLKTMEDFVTIPFMLKKLDIVAVPDFMAHAMENWGMVTFREEYSLFAQDVSNEWDKKNILTIICHEFAHQWFGDLITPAWWSDIWLNEGFARYFQYVLADLIEPSWRLLEDFTVNAVQSALAVDSDDTHAMSFTVLNDNDIKFDTVVYSKAASVIRMWELTFTRGVLQNALNLYLAKVSSADGIANTADLFTSFETAVMSSTFHHTFTVTEVLKNWTFTSGYPVVNVAVENGKLYAGQMRFSTNGTLYNTDHWYIPLTYTTQQENNFNDASPRAWLEPNQDRISIGDVTNNGWVVVNLNQTGYYRVNYSESMWQLLIAQLKTDLNKIPPTSRAQLIDDAFTFAKYNQLSYSSAFSLADYLVNELDYIPWVTATRHLKFIIESYYYFSGIDQIKVYAYSLYSNFYNKVINDVSSDHITKLARMEAFQWACDLGYQPCIDHALDLYKKWLRGSEIDPELKPGMLCTAVRHLPSDWTALNNKYLASKVSTDKVVFLKGLSCSDQKYLIQPFMKRSLVGLNGDVKRQNADIVVNALLETPDNVSPVIVFLLNNYLKMKQYLGATTVKSYVTTIGNKVTAHSELNVLLDAANNELLPLELRQQLSASYTVAKAKHTWCHNTVNAILQSVSSGLSKIVTTAAPTTATTVQPSVGSALPINCFLILLSLAYIYFRLS